MTTTPITRRDFPEIRWQGHWIWVPEEPVTPSGFMGGTINMQAKQTHGLFRKLFHLGHVPIRVPARISADSRYVLFVNGREVFRGPVRSQPRRLHYDLFDLAPVLQSGDNILAVYVTHYGTPKSYWMPAVPNLTLGKTGILVFEADLGEAGWLVSDASWKAHKADAWSDDWRSETEAEALVAESLPIEVFDARCFPHDWLTANFDDSAWGTAQLVPAIHIGGFARTQPPTDPYGPLYPRPIAGLTGEIRTPVSCRVEILQGQVDAAAIGDPVRRLEATVDIPVTQSEQWMQLPLTVEVPTGGMARLIFDMGRIVSGLVSFDLQAPAGTMLDLSYVEEPLVGPASMIAQHAGTRYIARGEHDVFQVFDSNGLRYAYVLVHGVQGTITLTHFAVREQLYPWQEGANFACDDVELNRIFQAGRRTVQLCSHDAFIDCPTREQRAWVGDSVVHQMVHLATNCDWRLAWHCLHLADTSRADGILPMSVAGDIEVGAGITIPDWALHWVHGVYNYYRFMGNRAEIKAFLPTVERVLRWYTPYQTAAGLLKDVPEWNLVDWSSVSVHDTSSLLTALWARGLREFAQMAAWLEERASQRWAEEYYEKARAGFEVFWDEERGSYIDHIVNGERQPEMSQLAGALAICAGLAPEVRWPRIINTITDAERLVVRSWVSYGQEDMLKQLRGIYEIDWDAERQIVLAEPFMSYAVHDAVALAGEADRLPDLYRRWSEFLVNGYDTLGECWGWGTHVHGWSCTPTRDMIFYTLGVTPATPGYTSARIAPRLGRLRWARGCVPTPHGLITVEVTADTVIIDSPVPVFVELAAQPVRSLAAGRYELAR